MVVNKITDVIKTKVDMPGAINAFKQVPVSQADGTPNYSLRVFTLEPEGHTPYHQHDYEHVNYIIEGSGEIVDENGTYQKIEKGDFVLVLPNEKHQYRNASSDENFVMICGVPKEFE